MSYKTSVKTNDCIMVLILVNTLSWPPIVFLPGHTSNNLVTSL